MKKKLRFKDFFKSFMILAVLCFSQIGLGQGTESISNLTSSATSYGVRTWTGDNGIANWNATDSRADQTITGKAITLRNGTLTFQLSPLQLSSGIGDLTLKAKAPFGSDVGSLQLVVNGNVIASKTVSGTSVTTHTWTSVNVSTITSIIINQTNSGSRITIDDISWTSYTSTNPNLATSPSTLGSFVYNMGSGPSTSQSFDLSGVNLTGFPDVITVNGSTNFEVSLDNSNFSSSLTVDYTTASLSSITIYVRLQAGLAIGDYNNQNITISGGGDADGATVTCSGSVLAPAPVNDLCDNATVLTLDGVNLSGSLLSSTFSAPFTSRNDVWYSFTPTCTGSHVLTVSNFSGDVDVTVFSNANSCPSNTTFIASAATTNSTETITSNFTAGVTYFVRVLAYDTAAESTFDINVVAPTPVTASVTTGLPSLITQTSATLNASNAVFGVCPSTTIKGFVYAETLLNNDPILGGSNVIDVPLVLGTAGSFNAGVSSLSSNISYTYKAYLYDGTTYTYGSVQNFTTLIPIPDAPLALDATSINDNQFIANWSSVVGADSYVIDVYKINSGTNATDLFISEYVEGSSQNKYIEIFNGTGNDIDLSDYRLQLFANGSSSVSNDNILVGTLANNSTIVYSNFGNIYGGVNFYSTSTNFNGDDAIALYKISTNSFVDIFGRIGNDPGSAWSSASNTTSDETLVRKSDVFGGITTNPTGTGSSAFSTLEDEWVSYPTDDVSNLGSHVFNGGTTLEYVSGFENLNVGNVQSYIVTGLESGTKYYYRVRALNTSGTSANSNTIEATTTGTVRWTGATNTNWSTASNWSNDLVPDGTYDIEIPSGNPVLDTAFTVATGSDLTISGTGSLTIAPTASLTVVGTTNFGGNSVILQSNATGTATIGEVSGTLSNATNVTVERYIPAKRAWRLLTAPLKGTTNNTIADNWQGTTNEGLLLFSPATFQSQAMTGYATGGNAPNIYQYGTSWQIIPDLNSEAIFGADATDTKAYQVFVTGGHGSSNIATGSQATTLRSTGELITGNVTHTLTANTYKLIANPYASPLNTEALVQANSGSKAWLLDPSVGFGAYVTYDGANWSITPSGNDANIQSGQGFLVRSTGTSFEIQESHKTTGNSNTWFERNASSTADKIRVLLYKAINNEWQLADGILAVNSADGNTAVDNTDAGKVSNFNESMMFRNGTNNLSIEYRALPQANEVQPIRLTGTAVTSYELRLFTENYNNSSLVPMLEDTQTGTFTTIPTDGSIVSVPFTGVVATGTNPDNRFRIVYQAALSNDVFNALHVSVYPNPVNEGFLNINLLEAGKATYNLYNLVGQEVLTGTLMTQNSQLTLSSLQTGVYILSIEQAGKKHTTKVVVE